MAVRLVYAPGATPLSPGELEGLIHQHIQTQGELDAWEQQNILDGRDRLDRRGPRELLSDSGVRLVHKRMFGDTWRWAGTYRRSDKNIGADWARIPGEVRLLCDDARYQRENKVYPADELAARFHHRLVSIHPFPNGNGRHARQMADMLLVSVGAQAFSWGSSDLNRAGETRDRYMQALRAADRHDYGLLFDFVRS